MSSSCSPIDKTLKDFQSCLYRISTQCLANWLVFLNKSKIGKVALPPPQKYSSGPKCRALDFNLAVFFGLGRRGYLLGVIQNKHEKFAIKYDNHFK